jgi:hypothetical protein
VAASREFHSRAHVEHTCIRLGNDVETLHSSSRTAM